MSWTKRQFIEQAFDEIGLASYVFDLSPEQLESALRRLDSMLAAWNGQGIRIGYPIPSSPDDSALDDDTGIPDIANEAVYTNLAVKLAPSYGKTVSSDTKAAAIAGMNILMGRYSLPPEKQITDLPSGAGAKLLNYPFLRPPVDTIDAGPDGAIEFN